MVFCCARVRYLASGTSLIWIGQKSWVGGSIACSTSIATFPQLQFDFKFVRLFGSFSSCQITDISLFTTDFCLKIRPLLAVNIQQAQLAQIGDSTGMAAPAETSSQFDELIDPLKVGLTGIDRKIRNLEKRKSKLDTLREDVKKSGKPLNDDQSVSFLMNHAFQSHAVDLSNPDYSSETWSSDSGGVKVQWSAFYGSWVFDDF